MQILMEKTAEFSRWFGCSRIVDENGQPMIVFHGTMTGCDRLRAKKRNPDLGFHFGSLAQAEWFAGYDGRSRTPSGSALIPAYLRIERPLCMSDVFERGRNGAESVVEWLEGNGVAGRAVTDKVFRAGSARAAYRHVMQAIEAAGYDGIIYENVWEGGTADTNEHSYIVFHSRQIWSRLSHTTLDLARRGDLDSRSIHLKT